ncbi:MAG: M23 family metallopeptidase [Rhodoblastus sp.]|nr:MAG: M23 family metallopeptidase [Rhodoblastus sp.]
MSLRQTSSLRQTAPKARLPDTHVHVTFLRDDRARTLSFKPSTLYAAAAAPLLAAAYFSTTVYLIFRDDMLAGMMSRQAEMQYAYEDKIAALRTQMDRVTSRQLLDQTSFEGKLHALFSRQTQLESRGSMMSSLATAAGLSGAEVTGAIAAPAAKPQGGDDAKISAKRAAVNPLLRGEAGFPAPPGGALAFADVGMARRAAPGKPSPLSGTDEPATRDKSPAPAFAVLDDTDAAPLPERLGRVAASLDAIELRQVRQIATLESRARSQAQGFKQAIEATGLEPGRLKPPTVNSAMGGPFVPLKLDRSGSLFEREAARLQDTLAETDRLRRLMPFMPVRRPLGPEAQQTSPFGARSDPFLGRAAMHAGLDFRDELGAPVRATAGGQIITAGWTGGYGNMVEIDHGNGLTTRYGHMMAINVTEGQHVAAGAIVGKLGSTGRSTGPHLHYETRIDGEAVDPARFLRAGARLFARGASQSVEE